VLSPVKISVISDPARERVSVSGRDSMPDDRDSSEFARGREVFRGILGPAIAFADWGGMCMLAPPVSFRIISSPSGSGGKENGVRSETRWGSS
jgi:hypothetical protein